MIVDRCHVTGKFFFVFLFGRGHVMITSSLANVAIAIIQTNFMSLCAVIILLCDV